MRPAQSIHSSPLPPLLAKSPVHVAWMTLEWSLPLFFSPCLLIMVNDVNPVGHPMPLLKTFKGMEIPLKKKKKLGIKLPYDPEIPLLGIYSEKTITEKNCMYPNVHHSTIYNS